jgi:arginase family enzyme
MRFSRALLAYGRPHATHSGNVSILGVPIDLGGNLRGVDMGPLSVRVAGKVYCLYLSLEVAPSCWLLHKYLLLLMQA